MTSFYEVIVGNIGKVYYGSDKAFATEQYLAYKGQSERGEGKAAGESVSMLRDGEVIRAYDGQGVFA